MQQQQQQQPWPAATGYSQLPTQPLNWGTQPGPPAFPASAAQQAQQSKVKQEPQQLQARPSMPPPQAQPPGRHPQQQPGAGPAGPGAPQATAQQQQQQQWGAGPAGPGAGPQPGAGLKRSPGDEQLLSSAGGSACTCSNSYCLWAPHDLSAVYCGPGLVPSQGPSVTALLAPRCPLLHCRQAAQHHARPLCSRHLPTLPPQR